MRDNSPIPQEAIKYLTENYQSMRQIDIALQLKVKPSKIRQWMRRLALKKQLPELTEKNKQYIRDNYLKTTDVEFVKIFGFKHKGLIQKFRDEEKLHKPFGAGRPVMDKEKRKIDDGFFNVSDRRGNWIM